MSRKPVGTNARPTADWFAGVTAMVGGLARAADSTGIQLSLYNDAPQGQYLWLWWFTVYNDAEGPYRLESFEGAAGTLLTQGSYVMAGRGAAFGACYYNSIPIANGDFPASPSQYPGMGYGGDEAGTNTCYRSPGPTAVLPPGFSFAVDNEWGGTMIGGATLAVTFYYSILPYIPTT